MPEINGFENIDSLKSHPQTVDIPSVIITGIDINDGRVKALALGASEDVNRAKGLKRLYQRIEKITAGENQGGTPALNSSGST